MGHSEFCLYFYPYHTDTLLNFMCVSLSWRDKPRPTFQLPSERTSERARACARKLTINMRKIDDFDFNFLVFALRHISESNGVLCELSVSPNKIRSHSQYSHFYSHKLVLLRFSLSLFFFLFYIAFIAVVLVHFIRNIDYDDGVALRSLCEIYMHCIHTHTCIRVSFDIFNVRIKFGTRTSI